MNKYLATLALLIGSSSVLMAAGPNNPANFETAKIKMSESADKRMEIIKEFKACINTAKDSAALKECRKQEIAAMKAAKPKKEPRPPRDEQRPPEPGAGKPGM